ncbi:MAG: GTPase HflX [Armatimonadota bacterium]|nr:GTPase HflX [Armatimonadota bacterium]MDR7453388.1 GTPase HflX [Armatimonadota bacterium]MDR7457207.1 GTPase HflX [Armatimonadota bacterium]MDR7496052.1 GTPase HflX [Armatimonadota bacterium]
MLEALGRRKAPHNRLAGRDVVEILCHLAQALRREVGVLLDRHGAVTHVLLSRRWQAITNEQRYRSRAGGLRYVEAHPQPDGRPDDGDRRALESLDLDLVLTAGTDRGAPTELWLLGPPSSRADPAPEVEGPYALAALADLELEPRVRLAEAARRGAGAVATGAGEAERAVLVGTDGADGGPSLEELARLAETAGARPVATVIQRRARPHPASYLGKGKVEEVRRASEAAAADLVLIDGELSPVQQRTLEGDLGVKVLDRTALVLDIFAQRARSREGRLQVELAQMNYLLPRLAGRGVWLSRLGGGIGTRGPGETKLEVDRRRIRARITELQRAIDAIQRHRGRQRGPRKATATPQVALVGYTNAGKSTLLNALTGAGAFVEDRLFATLDPTVRRLVLPNRRAVVLADTVGFIRRLPTELIAAFRGTLEEVVHADLLLHVVDASHPDWETQVRVVREVLADIGAADHPEVLVFNKTDRLAAAEVTRLRQAYPAAAVISAARGDGLEALVHLVARRLPEPWIRVRVKVPYADARLRARLHEAGRVLSERYDDDGVFVEAEVPGPLAVELRARRAG